MFVYILFVVYVCLFVYFVFVFVSFSYRSSSVNSTFCFFGFGSFFVSEFCSDFSFDVDVVVVVVDSFNLRFLEF